MIVCIDDILILLEVHVHTDLSVYIRLRGVLVKWLDIVSLMPFFRDRDLSAGAGDTADLYRNPSHLVTAVGSIGDSCSARPSAS